MGVKVPEMGYPDHFYLVVGIVEILGAVALLIPRVAKWGALALMGLMAGATATHAVHREPQIATALVLLAVLAIILHLRRTTAKRAPISAGPS